MGLSKFRIGQLVEQTTEINTDYLFGADDVRGMTITKQIIPTKADVSVADLSKFLALLPSLCLLTVTNSKSRARSFLPRVHSF